jgi:hypothetical protein
VPLGRRSFSSFDLNGGTWDPDPPDVDEAEAAMLAVAEHSDQDVRRPSGDAKLLVAGFRYEAGHDRYPGRPGGGRRRF